MDKSFIKLLTTLVKTKDLTQELANEAIIATFPNLEFLDNPEKIPKVLIRQLIPYKMPLLKQANIKEAFKLINKIYARLYLNQTTLDNVYSVDVRNPISKKYGVNRPNHKLSKTLVKISYEAKGEILKAYKDQVAVRHSEAFKYNIDEMLDVIKNNIVREEPFYRAIALALASGCRPIELFQKSNFTKVDQYWVLQDVLAKKKLEVVSVTKPILYLSADQFILEVKRMREDLHKKYDTFVTKNGQLNSNISSNANKAAKDIFLNRGGYTLYSSRKLYASLSYDLYGENKETIFGKSVTKQLWVASVLGHKPGDLSTANSYGNFVVTGGNNSTGLDSKELKVLEAKVDNLENRMDQEPIPQAPSNPTQT